MEKIEWFEDAGVMGGQKGLSVDLIDKTITHWHGKKEKINENNINNVIYVIEKNIESLKERKNKLESRINQTETIRIQIHNGYRILEKLNEEQIDKFKVKIENINNEIDEFEKIDVNALVE